MEVVDPAIADPHQDLVQVPPVQVVPHREAQAIDLQGGVLTIGGGQITITTQE